MKIGINARHLQNIDNGIVIYLLNLVLNLRKIDDRNEYTLFFGSKKNIPQNIFNFGFNYDIPKIPADSQLLKILWAHLYLPYAINKHKIDVFHETTFISPVFKKCPVVLTIYDLAYLYLPGCFAFRQRLYFKTLISRSIRQSDLIIAISENTKKDIINDFNVPPERIRVIYGGVDDIFRPLVDKNEIEEIKKIYKIKKDFILAVSLISPRKNMIRLIKAFKLLKDQKRIDIQLVIVGKKGWLYEDVFREAVSSGLEDDIIFCGHVPKEHLLLLYNAASVFAYPSLYEGFGLPVLEAMACGCPVVSSNTSSMPEVCQDTALLVDPEDIEELSESLYKLFSDESLKNDLIGKGLANVKKFSWVKTAKETLLAYNESIRYKG